MVAYLNAQIADYSLLDIVIVAVIILSIIILGFGYFSGSKKDRIRVVSMPAEENRSRSDIVQMPQITIVFQKDLSDDEELSREIADMYISNRAYYYAGEKPPSGYPILSEKSDGVFVKYESVDFSALSKIDI